MRRDLSPFDRSSPDKPPIIAGERRADPDDRRCDRRRAALRRGWSGHRRAGLEQTDRSRDRQQDPSSHAGSRQRRRDCGPRRQHPSEHRPAASSRRETAAKRVRDDDRIAERPPGRTIWHGCKPSRGGSRMPTAKAQSEEPVSGTPPRREDCNEQERATFARQLFLR